MNSQRWPNLVMVFFVLASMPQVALAHAVGVECRIEKQDLVVTGFFDDGTAASEARVTLFDATAKVVTTGKTDEDGKWSCRLQSPGRYRIRLDAGSGHIAHATVVVEKTAPALPQQPVVKGSPSTDSESPPPPSHSANAGNPKSKKPFEITTSTPNRERFTRFPWWNVGLGLAAIGFLTALGVFLVRRTRLEVRNNPSSNLPCNDPSSNDSSPTEAP